MNLLDAEQAIINRLKDQILDAKLVASTANIVGLLPDGITPFLPALFTQPGSAEVLDYAGNGLGTAEETEWIVVAAVKLLPDAANMASSYAPVGELLGNVATALAGWSPLPHYRPLRYAGRDEPEFSPGYVEFALRFSARRLFSGTGG